MRYSLLSLVPSGLDPAILASMIGRKLGARHPFFVVAPHVPSNSITNCKTGDHKKLLRLSQNIDPLSQVDCVSSFGPSPHRLPAPPLPPPPPPPPPPPLPPLSPQLRFLLHLGWNFHSVAVQIKAGDDLCL